MSESHAPTRKQHKSRSHPKATKWSQKEDNLLLCLVPNSRHVSWTELAPQFPGKTAQQISERWSKVVDPSLIKGGWTREEDETITNYVQQYGVKNWTKLAKLLPGRIGKQCRERWRNHLDPSNKLGSWTPDEDELLIKLHNEYGNSWVKIANFMPGRSDNCIKNRWNSTLKKRLNGNQMVNSQPNQIPMQQAQACKPDFMQSAFDSQGLTNMQGYINHDSFGGNIAIFHTPEKTSKPIDPPDSIPKPEWNISPLNNDIKQLNSGRSPSDSTWPDFFASPYLSKSPFRPFDMKTPLSPFMSNDSMFTPRLMRSPHFGNDASLPHGFMDILDKD